MPATAATFLRRRKPLTVGDVMTPQPITIGRDQTLETAHAMMRQHRLRHLPVLERGQLVGVVTQHDLYFIETIAGVDVERDPIDDAMTGDTYAVPPSTPIGTVTQAMAERRLGCAIVVENERVIGIFTRTDALRLIST